MTTTPITSETALSGAATAVSSPSAPTQAGNLANQNTFLQLLVAQLKNQDPQNPADGTQFVTQLAQFTTLQEQTKSTQDLDTILKLMQAAATPVAASGTTKN